MLTTLKRALHFFVFSSIYISLCAVMMVAQTHQVFQLSYAQKPYLIFVFFSTLCSYNFHWYLTPELSTEKIRTGWTQRNKAVHLILFVTGLAGAAWGYLFFSEHWVWLLVAVIFTFLYSAPKISQRPFIYLKKIAVGKTIYLAFIWMYVTTWLPLVLSETTFSANAVLFCLNRFFFIYAICILFDYRDRFQDRKDGILSMITLFSERGIDRLFYCSMLLFYASSLALGLNGFKQYAILAIFPGLILQSIYPLAKRNFSDYLYYILLDGLMMLPALLTLAFCL